MIQLNFTYTEADMRAFTNYYYQQGRGRRSLYLIAGALLLFVGYNLFKGGFSGPALLGTLIPAALMLALWWVIYRFTVKRSMTLAPQMREPRRCTIQAEGLQVEAETFTADYTWADFQKKVETSEAFLLFTTQMTAVILPKRAFLPDQLATFKTYLN